MPTKCDNTKQAVSNIEESSKIRERQQEEFWENNKSIARFLNYSKEDLLVIEGKLANDDFELTTEKDLDNALKDRGKKAIIAAKIVGLMEGSELLTDLSKEIVLNHLPKDYTVQFKKGQIDYSKIPMSTLNNIYREFLIFADADDGTSLAKGVYGSVVVPVMTPKQLSRRERTGSVYKMFKGVQRYHKAISRRMSDFNNAPVTTKSKKKRNYGMNDVINAVRDLSSDLRWSNIPEKKDKLVSLFSKMMIGHVYIDKKTGEFMVYKDWMPTGKVYESTGDSIYQFQTPVKLKDYTPNNDVKGAWDLPLSKRAKKELLKQIEKARVVDNELFEYTNFHFNRSVEKIITSLSDFTKIKESQLKRLIESKDYKNEAVYKLLKKDQRKALDALYDVFGDFVQIRPVMYGSTNVQYKQNHYPVIYPDRTFPFLWDRMIKELNQKLERINSELKTIEGEDRTLLLKERTKTIQALSRSEFIRDRMDEYPMDVTQNITMPLAKDVKHMESITNAIDIRNMRTDSAVYQRYTKHIMSAIERNLLVAQFIDSYKTAESDFSRNYILNLFKIPFNRPDIEGNFLGFKHTTQGIIDKLGLSTPANVIQDNARIMSSWLTATNLSGWGTTIQNFLAMHQNIVNYGLGHINEAWDDYNHNKDKWGRLIAASGIAEFGDFFNDALVKEMSGLELESDITKRLHIAMMNYMKLKNDKLFKEEVKEILEGSGLWMDEVHFDPLSEGVENYKKRIEKRQKTLKRKRRIDFTNKMVAYAISMEWKMNKNIKGWKYIPAKLADITIGNWAKLRRSMGKFGTMSNTEEFIRSISFIIGVRRGQKSGYLPAGNPWDFNTDDRNRAISMGSDYQEFTNFGLSTQNVGQFNWGDVGKLTGKFKFWSQQKAGLDFRIIRDAIVSFKEFEDIKGTKGDLFDSKAIYRLMKSLGKKGIDKTNPEAARFRRFLLWQGIPTIFFDLLLSPVAFIPGVRGWFYQMPGFKPLRGLGSDVLSLALMPITIGLRLLIGGLLFGDDEDMEKEAKDTVKYYMRKTYFGYVPIWSAEAVLDLAYTLLMEGQGAGEAVSTVISPASPDYSIQKKAAKIVDSMLDN